MADSLVPPWSLRWANWMKARTEAAMERFRPVARRERLVLTASPDSGSEGRVSLGLIASQSLMTALLKLRFPECRSFM